MKFGLGIPNCREGKVYPENFANPKEIMRLTQLAEQLGFYSAWATDYIAPVPAMEFPKNVKPNWYELIVTLSYLAAVTDKIKLASGVLLLPFRDPVVLARQIITLDQFSEGRLLLGCGLGQYRDEFLTINSRNKGVHRGDLMDEIMESLYMLLNQEGQISFEGKYISFNNIQMHPKTMQNPVPVYIGGHSKAMGRRVAKWAKGVSYSSVAMLDETIGDRLSMLKPHMDEMGRTIDELDVVISTYLCFGKDLNDAISKCSETYIGRRLLRRVNLETFASNSLFGTPNQIIERIYQLQSQGMKHCVITNVCVDNYADMLEQVQIFGEDVISNF